MRSVLLSGLALFAGCSGSEEAATVELPVATAAGALAAATTDLGYTVQLDRVRIAVSTIQFTIEGEAHAATPPPGTVLHPGHSAGGEVTGELPGDFVLVWDGSARPALGTGTLIVGDYRGANFTFRGADARDALPTGDPLVGHAVAMTGSVTRDGASHPFDVVLDVEPGAAIIGATFDDAITAASQETLALVFYPTDPSEGDTAFDGIDFFALPRTGAAIEIRPGSDAHNILRRVVTTHDHYGVLAQ